MNLFRKTEKRSLKDLGQVIAETEEILKIDFSNLKPWKELKEWPLNATKNIDGSVNTKILDEDNHLRFFTMIPPNVSFPKHMHNCTEVASVLSGFLTDKITGKEWREGEKAVFAAGTDHTPINNSQFYFCYLIVDFYK